MHPVAPPILTLIFTIIPAVVALLVVTGILKSRPGASPRGSWAACTVAGVLAMFGIPAGLAASGVLLDFSTLPPPFMGMVVALLGTATWFGFSRVGQAVIEKHSFAALVGLQCFRLPLELAMHYAADVGIMPSVMSYDGYNYDILTGVLALTLVPFLRRAHPPLVAVWAWNVLGLALLINVLQVAVRATPVFEHFGPEQRNTWVAYVPFIWLPSVLVTTAWSSHILIFRKLLQARRISV